ncbi:hypothetical protein FAF44_43220 [Nonomuraea sp. MG754425]|uniref:hypothetical protein n=1 Tax=Nonomuraea sp. MG754425 TaxID=2570319 RepID=UPI001F1A5258|nr:hypothetical protein [Nonomuraea sp. MG754425]MCF6475136.1 hypothetical protein [Nonomuraea sp. MG754425]
MAFGVREFELTLMHRMRDVNAAKVEEALGRMHASRAELREAHARWTRLAHAPRAPKGAAALRMALGPPPHRGRRPAGSLTCDVLRWPLPSWPGLAFEALLGPGGELWNQWFVRPSGPAAPSFAELTPWACVVADVGAGFPGAVQIDGPAPHHWTIDLRHDGRVHRARFVHGLLQRLDPAPEAHGRE